MSKFQPGWIRQTFTWCDRGQPYIRAEVEVIRDPEHKKYNCVWVNFGERKGMTSHSLRFDSPTDARRMGDAIKRMLYDLACKIEPENAKAV